MQYSKAAIASLLVLLSSVAFAETTWDVMKRFGWSGNWAPSCNVPASSNTYWYNYFTDASGLAKRKTLRGADQPPLLSVIDSAKIITSTTMRMRVRNADTNYGGTNGLAFDILLAKENGRMRTIESKGSDGKVYIKDGNFVSSGAPAAWLEKCPD